MNIKTKTTRRKQQKSINLAVGKTDWPLQRDSNYSSVLHAKCSRSNNNKDKLDLLAEHRPMFKRYWWICQLINQSIHVNCTERFDPMGSLSGTLDKDCIRSKCCTQYNESIYWQCWNTNGCKIRFNIFSCLFVPLKLNDCNCIGFGFVMEYSDLLAGVPEPDEQMIRTAEPQTIPRAWCHSFRPGLLHVRMHRVLGSKNKSGVNSKQENKDCSRVC